MIRFFTIIINLFVIGCNSGSVGITTYKQSGYDESVNIYGLNNLGNSCYINAALQLVSHSPILRSEVITKNPAAPFSEFFAAYADGRRERIDDYHKKIAMYIYSLPGQAPNGVIGSPQDVLFGDQFTFFGVNLNNLVVDDITNIDLQRNHLYSFAVNYPSITVGYSDLPYKDRINGFIYNRGGHYVAYVQNRENYTWSLIDDIQIHNVTEAELLRLPHSLISGIELVSY